MPDRWCVWDVALGLFVILIGILVYNILDLVK